MKPLARVALAAALTLSGGASAAPPGGHGLEIGMPRNPPLVLVQRRGGGQVRAAHPNARANVNRGNFNRTNVNRANVNRQNFNSNNFQRDVTVNRNVNVNGGCCSSNWGPNWGGVAAGAAVGIGVAAAGAAVANAATYPPPPPYPYGYPYGYPPQ